MTTKRYGQHFLIDRAVLEREADYADLRKTDSVLEIGAGDGRLTEVLAARAGKVYAVERDPKLARILRSRRLGNVEVIEGDILSIELPKFDKVVSNIPYYLSTPITFLLLENLNWKVAVLTYQKEFGERLAAKPGSKNYSRISAFVSSRCEVEILETVPREKFRPVPKVDSVIVRMVPDPKDYRINWGLISRIFSHRKKLVKNALRCAGIRAGIPEEIASKRVFQCTLEDLEKISGCVKC